MSIFVHRFADGTLQLLSGSHRLHAALSVFGHAVVQVVETGEQFRVHQVDGRLVALADPHAHTAEAGSGTSNTREAP